MLLPLLLLLLLLPLLLLLLLLLSQLPPQPSLTPSNRQSLSVRVLWQLLRAQQLEGTTWKGGERLRVERSRSLRWKCLCVVQSAGAEEGRRLAELVRSWDAEEGAGLQTAEAFDLTTLCAEPRAYASAFGICTGSVLVLLYIMKAACYPCQARCCFSLFTHTAACKHPAAVLIILRLMHLAA